MFEPFQELGAGDAVAVEICDSCTGSGMIFVSSGDVFFISATHFIFASNGNNDNITVIDIRKDSIVREIFLKPDDALKHFRGVIPFGLAVSPDEKQLFG